MLSPKDEKIAIFAVDIENRAGTVAINRGICPEEIVIGGPRAGPHWRAEMILAVTVLPRPKGLPIARTRSPTQALPESPHSEACNGLGAPILSNARSVLRP